MPEEISCEAEDHKQEKHVRIQEAISHLTHEVEKLESLAVKVAGNPEKERESLAEDVEPDSLRNFLNNAAPTIHKLAERLAKHGAELGELLF